MSEPTYVRALRIPKVTLEYAKHLKETFKPQHTVPGRSLDSIMYEAGQQSVIRYVERTAVDAAKDQRH